jgi:hypothetical protein
MIKYDSVCAPWMRPQQAARAVFSSCPGAGYKWRYGSAAPLPACAYENEIFCGALGE